MRKVKIRNGWMVLAAALAIIALPGYLQIARSQQAKPAPTPATSAASERALLDRYLRHLPQPALADRGAGAR
jgi:hypothetical protein